jgi:hypothetical protein
MNSRELMKIIESLMELGCLVLNDYNNFRIYTFVYRNYAITLNENNIWFCGDAYSYPCYNDGQVFYKKVRDYSHRKVSIDNMKGMIDRDLRKLKLEKINSL